MDPNAALARIRELIANRDFPEWADEYGDDLAELIEGLDEAMTRGMFLPEDWAKSRSFESRKEGLPCETCGTWHSRCP